MADVAGGPVSSDVSDTNGTGSLASAENSMDVDMPIDTKADEGESLPFGHLYSKSLCIVYSLLASPTNGSSNGDECIDGENTSLNESVDITGLKIKEFEDAEKEAFKKPFDIGWKREVVIRGSLNPSGRRVGDVYYFAPDRSKLRSYVELVLFCK